jgi:5-carboxymethyl-2-hydroxymuconate isomerase
MVRTMKLNIGLKDSQRRKVCAALHALLANEVAETRFLYLRLK